MNFDQNISLLKRYLKNLGCVLEKEDTLFDYYKSINNLEIKIPKVKTDIGYIKVFELNLKKAGRIYPELAKLPLYSNLTSQLKNMAHKFNQSKNEWILSEPNSKYGINEIPHIYIPKNDNFGDIE